MSKQRLLFVSNGNGEAAIADRIAQEVHACSPQVQIDHLALVGEAASQFMSDVGPQQIMPSGGLIAMGNLRNIVRDLRSGLIGLTLAQRQFLVQARGWYTHVVAVGDVYALLMSLAAHTPTTFIGTAKSVRVAAYGRLEERVLHRAAAVFVRDDATAERLRAHGIDAQAPGNVIVDLFATDDDPRAGDALAAFAPAIAIFPGSRASAYGDARFLAGVVREAARTRPGLGAAISLAPLLDPQRFIAEFTHDGWHVETTNDARIPFELRDREHTIVRAWRGAIGPLLSRVQLVIGQAGTANEAAAAAGVPVVAFELGNDRKTAWYRMRQHGLLGDALAVFSGDRTQAAQQVGALLDDQARRTAMGAIGRERMGSSGGARAIAHALVESL